MTATSREYEMTYGDPRPRMLACWALAAVSKARRDHFAHYGSAPHTVYVDGEFWCRMMQEIIHYSDTIGWTREPLYVLGMLVKVEGVDS